MAETMCDKPLYHGSRSFKVFRTERSLPESVSRSLYPAGIRLINKKIGAILTALTGIGQIAQLTPTYHHD